MKIIFLDFDGVLNSLWFFFHAPVGPTPASPAPPLGVQEGGTLSPVSVKSSAGPAICADCGFDELHHCVTEVCAFFRPRFPFGTPVMPRCEYRQNRCIRGASHDGLHWFDEVAELCSHEEVTTGVTPRCVRCRMALPGLRPGGGP